MLYYYKVRIWLNEKEWGDPLFCLVKETNAVKDPCKKSVPRSVADVCRVLAQPLAQQLGLTLWDVRFLKEGATWYLRIFIDKEGGVTLDDCVAMTHLIDPVLDREDPIPQSYCLEVSSPGIERELTRPEHFEQYLGRPVVLQLYASADGAREIAGQLCGYQDGTVTLLDAEGQRRCFSKKETVSVRAAETFDDIDVENGEE